MKKTILLLLSAILSTNVFLVDKALTLNEETMQIIGSEEEKVEPIEPTGAWFTKNDELL